MQGMQMIAPATPPNRNNSAQKSTPDCKSTDSFESAMSESLPNDDAGVSNVSEENAAESQPTISLDEELIDPAIAPETATPPTLYPLVVDATPIQMTPVTNENSSENGEKKSQTSEGIVVPLKITTTSSESKSSSETDLNRLLPSSSASLLSKATPLSQEATTSSYINLSTTQSLGTDHAGQKITVTEEMIHQAGPQFWELSGGTWDSNVSPLKLATQNAPGESLQLSSTHRLQDVVDSVFEERPLPTPRRIEIELKTPEGAKISLYIARVQGELRAQFSANSAQSLAWLQQEIHQLRGTDMGQAVRWLPPQVETSSKSVEKSKGGEFSSDSETETKKDRGLEDLFEIFKTPTRRLA